MKLPRWLVIAMLTTSVLSVLASAGWWVTWPERTTRLFTSLVVDGRFEEATQLIDQPKQRDSNDVLNGKVLQSRLKDKPLLIEDRSIIDLIKGRRLLDGLFPEGTAGGVFVIVERGRIRVKDDYGGVYSLSIE